MPRINRLKPQSGGRYLIKSSLCHKLLHSEAQTREIKVHLIQTAVAKNLYMFINSPAHSYSNHSMQCYFANVPMDFHVNCSFM